VRLFEGFDVLQGVPRLKNDRLQRTSRKDQVNQLDSKHAGMGIVCYYEVEVAAFEVARQRVIPVCCNLNVHVGVDAFEKSSNQFLSTLVVFDQ